MRNSREIRVCPAAREDIRLLLPRPESGIALLRQAQKLRMWQPGTSLVLDATVTPVSGTGIHELCVTDRFGFHCGLRLAFFEDHKGRLWIIGGRRDDEPLTMRMVGGLLAREQIVRNRLRGTEFVASC